MSCHISPWVYPLWDSLCVLDLCDYFLSHIREVCNYHILKYFLWLFLFPLFFWCPCNSMFMCLTLSQISLRLFYFFKFFFLCSLAVISTILSSSSLICSASVILLLMLSSLFFISVFVLFMTIYLFFISSSSLLNFSYIFFSICASILLLRFWIIVIVNSFSDRLPILSLFDILDFYPAPLPVIYSFVFLFFYFFYGQVYVPVLLVFWSEASSTGACRQLVGARFWCWDEDLGENSQLLIFPVVWGSLLVQWSGLSAPTIGARPEPQPVNQGTMQIACHGGKKKAIIKEAE